MVVLVTNPPTNENHYSISYLESTYKWYNFNNFSSFSMVGESALSDTLNLIAFISHSVIKGLKSNAQFNLGPLFLKCIQN